MLTHMKSSYKLLQNDCPECEDDEFQGCEWLVLCLDRGQHHAHLLAHLQGAGQDSLASEEHFFNQTYIIIQLTRKMI